MQNAIFQRTGFKSTTYSPSVEEHMNTHFGVIALMLLKESFLEVCSALCPFFGLLPSKASAAADALRFAAVALAVGRAFAVGRALAAAAPDVSVKWRKLAKLGSRSRFYSCRNDKMPI